MTLNPVWLRPNRTEALTVTDKRQAPPVKSTWHQASFSLADAKSMTEALAGGKASLPTPRSTPTPPGSPVPLAPLLSWFENPATGLLYRRVIVGDDDDNLSLSLCYLNPSPSCLLTPSRLPPPSHHRRRRRRSPSRPIPLLLAAAFVLACCSLRKSVSNVCVSEELSSKEKQAGGCEK